MKYNYFLSKKCGAVASIISGGANIGATAIGNRTARKIAEDERNFNAEQAQINRDYQTAERLATQEYNLEMWNRSNAWNLEQWHRQNEYDSPVAQLQRAREAGINPLTAIGSMYGGRSADVSASPVTSSPMSGSLAQYSSGLSSSIMGAYSQLGVNTANMLNTLADKKTKDYWLSYDQMTEQQRVDILNATAENLLKDIDIKDVNIDTAKVVLGNLAEMKEQELLNLRALAKKLEVETRSEEASIVRDDAVAQSNIKATEASIVRDDALAKSTIDTNNSMQSLQNQQTKESEERTEGQSQLNEFAKLVGCPVGTPEYLFIKKLYDEQKLSEFIDKAYRPLERAKMTPDELNTTTGTTFTIFDKDFGWLNKGKGSHNENLAEFLGVGDLYRNVKHYLNPFNW